jgi:alpha-beta hydrolase superfamily lysophospholipase
MSNILTSKAMSEVMKAADRLRSKPTAITFPILILQGGDDPVADKPSNIAWYKTLETDKTMCIYQGNKHSPQLTSPLGGKHEPINEGFRDEALLTIAKWIKDHVGLSGNDTELPILNIKHS